VEHRWWPDTRQAAALSGHSQLSTNNMAWCKPWRSSLRTWPRQAAGRGLLASWGAACTTCLVASGQLPLACPALPTCQPAHVGWATRVAGTGAYRAAVSTRMGLRSWPSAWQRHVFGTCTCGRMRAAEIMSSRRSRRGRLAATYCMAASSVATNTVTAAAVLLDLHTPTRSRDVGDEVVRSCRVLCTCMQGTCRC
jgi:hypothetical protein